MVFATGKRRVGWPALEQALSDQRQTATQRSYDKEVPWVQFRTWHESNYMAHSQVKMFFSSGAAHTNGGGSFCIAAYSFES